MVLHETTLPHGSSLFVVIFRNLVDLFSGGRLDVFLIDISPLLGTGWGWNVRVTSSSVNGAEIALHVSPNIEYSEKRVKCGFASRSDEENLASWLGTTYLHVHS